MTRVISKEEREGEQGLTFQEKHNLPFVSPTW